MQTTIKKKKCFRSRGRETSVRSYTTTDVSRRGERTFLIQEWVGLGDLFEMFAGDGENEPR